MLTAIRAILQTELIISFICATHKKNEFGWFVETVAIIVKV